MERVDFYGLSRVVQERLIASTRGTEAPTPIVRAHGTGDRLPWVWLAIAALAAVALVVFVRLGYGRLGSGLVVHEPPLLAVHALLIVVTLAGVLSALARWARAAALPFRPGIYVFPACAIDARTDALRVWPIGEVTAVHDSTTTLRVTLASGATFAFPLGDRARTDEASRALAAARTAAAGSGGKPDLGALVGTDPLYEPRFSSPLGPQQPMPRRAQAWARGRWPLALALGALAGYGSWAARNRASDDQMFAAARAQDDVDGYRAYLAHGRRHRAEVADALLPRAELKVAQKAGTVEAIEAYVAAHPGSKIGDEVATALRTAMLASLETAKQPGTLAALDAFAKAHPDHHLEPELTAAIHGVYVAALEHYKAVAPPKSDAAQSLVARLLAYAEKHGPSVEVRFRYKASKNLKTVDKVVAKNANFNGEQSYPSKYFDADDLRPLERTAAEAIAARFDAAFPPELLHLAAAAPFADLDEGAPDDLPAVTLPTLIVMHHEEWSGVALVNKNPRGIFVGITAAYDVAFVIPGDPKPLKLKYVAVRNVPLPLLKELGKDFPPKEPPEKAVYAAMSKEAFELLVDRVGTTFFR